MKVGNFTYIRQAPRSAFPEAPAPAPPLPALPAARMRPTHAPTPKNLGLKPFSGPPRPYGPGCARVFVRVFVRFRARFRYLSPPLPPRCPSFLLSGGCERSGGEPFDPPPALYSRISARITRNSHRVKSPPQRHKARSRRCAGWCTAVRRRPVPRPARQLRPRSRP